MSILKIVGACLALILTVGCASTGDRQMIVSGDKKVAETIFDQPLVQVNSIVRKSSLLEGTVREIDVTQVAMVGADGKARPIFDPRTGHFVLVMQMVDSFVTNPIGRDLVTGVAPIVAGTLIQTHSNEKIAKMCADGKCSGGGAGSQAVAGAANENKVSIEVNVGGPSCAQTGTCVPAGD